MGVIHADKNLNKAWCGYTWKPDDSMNGAWGNTSCLACLEAGKKSFGASGPKYFDSKIAKVLARIPKAPDTEADLWG